MVIELEKVYRGFGCVCRPEPKELEIAEVERRFDDVLVLWLDLFFEKPQRVEPRYHVVLEHQGTFDPLVSSSSLFEPALLISPNELVECSPISPKIAHGEVVIEATSPLFELRAVFRAGWNGEVENPMFEQMAKVHVMMTHAPRPVIATP
tara:strand:- start:120 stop:569 length:450 start_codon:yes stop_codon:yes gene_type:complete